MVQSDTSSRLEAGGRAETFALQESVTERNISHSTQRSSSSQPVPSDDISRGRIAIFIDAANLFRSALQLDLTIDYTKLLAHLVNRDRLFRAFFYAGVNPTNDKQKGFMLWMRHNGYRVITKELAQYSEGSRKANVSVEIAVDMLSLVDHYNTAVLVSGDDDLAYAINTVSYKGNRVEIVGLRSMMSDSLIGIADQYTDLSQIIKNIQKAP
ncbi:MAG TPA: NYN domain-containing protein [Leptolyngbyaceae cyanobacterium M33_DOE_097]|nr:NYN domain-containing protein [Leptolyngbyaceae cyanobacterium M33_DOE_097]